VIKSTDKLQIMILLKDKLQSTKECSWNLQIDPTSDFQ